MKKILLVSRNFPPTGGVGVERVTKYAKYLPQFGWQPTVLTATRGLAGMHDDAYLTKDINDVEVIRCFAPDLFSMYDWCRSRFRSDRHSEAGFVRRSYVKRGPWHPKSWLVPDSQILWYPLAVRRVMRASRQQRWDVVYGTSAPPINFLIAYRLSRRLGIPLFLDYRDPWTNAFFSPQRPRFLARFEERLETRIYSSAKAVATLDPCCVVVPERNAPTSQPLQVIPNGYDEADFKDLVPVEMPYFSIVHTGNLSVDRPLLPMWSVLEQVLRDAPELKGKIHFWQVGTVDGTIETQMKEAPVGVEVHYVPPVAMREALRYMMGADLLLVASADKDKNMPAKIYQYLRAGPPILGLIEPGADGIADMVKFAGDSFACYKSEATTASPFVLKLARRGSRQKYVISKEIEQFSRFELTRKFAGMLSEICSSN